MVMENEQSSEPTQHQPRNSFKQFLRKHKSSFFSVVLFASAFLTALLLNAFIFQPYEVEGSSMEPTLHNADRLIVNKTSKTWSRITGSEYIPKRGDIIVFHSHLLDKQLIKRVVALPGERVVIRDGVVTVYNDQYPNGFNPDQLINSDFYDETQGNLESTIEDGTVYVLGDNRLPNASQDSRSFGAVSAEDIIGVLSVRIYPFNKIDNF